MAHVVQFKNILKNQHERYFFLLDFLKKSLAGTIYFQTEAQGQWFRGVGIHRKVDERQVFKTRIIKNEEKNRYLASNYTRTKTTLGGGGVCLLPSSKFRCSLNFCKKSGRGQNHCFIPILVQPRPYVLVDFGAKCKL